MKAKLLILISGLLLFLSIAMAIAMFTDDVSQKTIIVKGAKPVVLENALTAQPNTAVQPLSGTEIVPESETDTEDNDDEHDDEDTSAGTDNTYDPLSEPILDPLTANDEVALGKMNYTDYNGDGLVDVVNPEIDGFTYVYINIGTNANPKYKPGVKIE